MLCLIQRSLNNVSRMRLRSYTRGNNKFLEFPLLYNISNFLSIFLNFIFQNINLNIFNISKLNMLMANILNRKWRINLTNRNDLRYCSLGELTAALADLQVGLGFHQTPSISVFNCSNTLY